MPSGKVHYSAWKAGLLPASLIAVTYAAATSSWIGLLLIIGYLLGRWVDPDQDQLSLSDADGRLMRELKFLGLLVVMWFLPYAYIMRFLGGHRSAWTHFPLVSTAIRLAWLLTPLLVSWYAVYRTLPTPLFWQATLSLYLGLSLADVLHYVLDLTVKSNRRGK